LDRIGLDEFAAPDCDPVITLPIRAPPASV
jgi:hypothetical protein